MRPGRLRCQTGCRWRWEYYCLEMFGCWSRNCPAGYWPRLIGRQCQHNIGRGRQVRSIEKPRLPPQKKRIAPTDAFAGLPYALPRQCPPTLYYVRKGFSSSGSQEISLSVQRAPGYFFASSFGNSGVASPSLAPELKGWANI